MLLVKDLYQLKRNCLKLCLEFLRELTTFELDNSDANTDKLQSIFHPQENLSSYNIQSMVLVLKTMIENIATLFDHQKLKDKPQKVVFKAIENPPVFEDMVP